MKYKYYLLALLTGILFLTGCYDDKGNYDYKEINDIVIDTVGFKMTYTVLQYEELQIDPTVAFTRNPIPEGNLSYEWYIYQPGKTATWKPVSTEKKLDIPVSHVPGDYKAVIYVTDNSRGVTSNMEFDLIVSTDIHHGFVIVHGSNGETDFDYLATPNSIPDLDRVKWLRNILEANGRKLPGNPTTIRVAGRNYGNFNAMYVASDQDLFQIDDKTFQFLHDADELFIDKPAEVNVVGLGVNGDTRLFFMANGDMHEIMSDRPTWDYAIPAPIAISDAVEGEVKVWKENVLPNGYSYLYPMVVYDVAGQRFLGRNNYPACLAPFPEQDPGNIFDINHIGKEILFLGRGYNYITYAIFKDPGQPNYWLYSMDFNVRSDATNVPLGIKNMSALPEIASAKFFEIGTLGEVLIYASDRNVYLYDYGEANTAIKISPDFPSGEEITSIRIYKPTLLSAVNERLLYIATWNGTQGKVYEFGFNPASGRLTSQTPLNTFEGGGKVADMNIKPHFNTW